MQLSENALRTQALTKDYGNGHGLFDLDLTVQRGEVFGFIGANGAGKSTLIRLIMDLIRPNHGSIEVLGMDWHRDAIQIKKSVGYLPGELPQWPKATAGHIIAVLAGLRGGVDERYVEALATRLQLDLDRKYSDLSHGNKQKVGLVSAFMHRPKLLVLDEPTIGLDPLIQREVRSLIAESIKAGATCLLSSHVLAEVELVCDRIGFISQGRLVKVGSLDQLRQVSIHTVKAVFDGGFGEDDANQLRQVIGVSNVTVDDQTLLCTVNGSMAALISYLANYHVIEMDSREMSLEEVFFADFGH